MKTKVLKIKIGNVYIDDKNDAVFADAWQKESDDGNVYYELRMPIFVSEVELKDKEKKERKITA